MEFPQNNETDKPEKKRKASGAIPIVAKAKKGGHMEINVHVNKIIAPQMGRYRERDESTK